MLPAKTGFAGIQLFIVIALMVNCNHRGKDKVYLLVMIYLYLMKTYLTIQLSSEGATFSDVVELLEDLGFEPIKGQYDFVYNWKRNSNVKDILWFGDRIHTALKGKKVFFRMETIEDDLY
ncbi:MAG: hypothetical protein M1481_02175 [Candidatus Thermoplasmatota archaeon]|nr:hypothetical protein [Candidatus Thermoplasmatota archaeon]MCL5962752.1 hypothetical protein [Candidatus Thermoplasmatota archaeon]